jgi:hypothetical protein
VELLVLFARVDLDRDGETSILRNPTAWLSGATIACAAFVCLTLLYAVGQPLLSDDAWWHLALGAAYAQQGPWLDADPLLFTAIHPPAPAAWLADWLLFRLWSLTGFTGLRVAHVALVASTLGLAWLAIRRASRSIPIAWLGTAVFAVLAAYRVVQLRPHLFSILGTLMLYLLLFEDERPPSWRRVAIAAACVTLWSNLHPAFPLGLGLLGACFGAALLGALLGPRSDRALPLKRATRLGVALVIAGLASTLNPTGLDGHLLALRTGSSSEPLAFVVDEWRRTGLLSIPVANLPPSLLSWLLVWILLLGSGLAGMRTILRRRSEGSAGRLDLVPLTLAATALVAMVMASRFLWLGIFPILVIARRSVADGVDPPTSKDDDRPGVATASALTIAALLVALAFYPIGAWPMLTRGLPRTLEGYALPYAASKYPTEATWLMGDAGLEGNLFAPYSASGFLGFWLSPALRTAVNGSLNLPTTSMQAYLAARTRLGTADQPDFEALLDDLGVDLFLGTGAPTPIRENRPADYTTLLLDRSAGWLLVFRNLDSALYLRNNARNEANLRALVEYYARSRVPFDPSVGFEPARVLREAPDWAFAQRLVPADLADAHTWPESDPRRNRNLSDAAVAFLMLGEYDESRRLNDLVLENRPLDPAALRRRIWLEIQTTPPDELETLRGGAARLAQTSPDADPSRHLLSAAKVLISGHDLAPRSRALLPVLLDEEAGRVLRRSAAPAIRTTRTSKPTTDQR